MAEDSKEEAGAATERSSERRRQWLAVARPLWLSGRARAGEGEWMSANGTGWRSKRDRGLLVADQGVSTPAHARHATAEPCRLARAARRSRPSCVDAGAGTGTGKARSWAGPALARGPEARSRPVSPPFPLPFFLNFFPKYIPSSF